MDNLLSIRTNLVDRKKKFGKDLSILLDYCNIFNLYIMNNSLNDENMIIQVVVSVRSIYAQNQTSMLCIITSYCWNLWDIFACIKWSIKNEICQVASYSLSKNNSRSHF